MNQMVPQMPQGHFMGMNPMHSGSLPTSGGPPQAGGFPNMQQGPPNTGGGPMYPQSGAFNRPQAGQMPMMPGYNPYQVRLERLIALIISSTPLAGLRFGFYILLLFDL